MMQWVIIQATVGNYQPTNVKVPKSIPWTLWLPNNVKLKAEAKKFHAQAMHKLNTFALNIFGMFYSCLGKSIFQS